MWYFGVPKEQGKRAYRQKTSHEKEPNVKDSLDETFQFLLKRTEVFLRCLHLEIQERFVACRDLSTLADVLTCQDIAHTTFARVDHNKMSVWLHNALQVCYLKAIVERLHDHVDIALQVASNLRIGINLSDHLLFASRVIRDVDVLSCNLRLY